MIAGAIALEPQLIVADEPVASLDASVRGEILRLMLGLVQQTQVAMIVVTHDLGLAWNVADRIAVMYLGRIVEIGTTEEVLEAPKHPYTRALLSVVPEIEQMEPQILHGEPPDPTKIPPGCRFHPRCPMVASGAAAERSGSSSAARPRIRGASRCAPGTPPPATRPPSTRSQARNQPRPRDDGRCYWSRRGMWRYQRRDRNSSSPSCTSSSTVTSNASWSERTSSRASLLTVASGHATT